MADEATRARLRYCRLIQGTGQRLRMSQKAIVSAMEYCHRYYAAAGPLQGLSNAFVLAGAALFLAGKAVETPKRLRELLKALVSVAYAPKPLVEAYLLEPACQELLRESVLTGERALLYALRLDLGADLALEHVLHFFLQPSGRALSDLSPRRAGHPVLLQVAYDIASDSARTTLCLLYDARTIAMACIWMATKALKIADSTEGPGPAWWESTDLTTQQLQDVVEGVARLYADEQAEVAQMRCRERG